MSPVSPKIIAVDLEKAIPDATGQDKVFSLVEYLDEEGLTLLHEVLRTKLVLKVIGSDRRNPDVKNLLSRLSKQWKVLERTIKTVKMSKTDSSANVKELALATLKDAIADVTPMSR